MKKKLFLSYLSIFSTKIDHIIYNWFPYYLISLHYIFIEFYSSLVVIFIRYVVILLVQLSRLKIKLSWLDFQLLLMLMLMLSCSVMPYFIIILFVICSFITSLLLENYNNLLKKNIYIYIYQYYIIWKYFIFLLHNWGFKYNIIIFIIIFMNLPHFPPTS